MKRVDKLKRLYYTMCIVKKQNKKEKEVLYYEY
ncbi:hypothetical protein [Lactovum miscens]